MSATAAAAAAAPEEKEERPAKKAHFKPRRITDFEHTLDTLLNEVMPEDRKMPIELIELMTEYVAPCNFIAWTQIPGNFQMTYCDHGWDAMTVDCVWQCWMCHETRPLNKPL